MENQSTIMLKLGAGGKLSIKMKIERWAEKEPEYNNDKRYIHHIARYKTRTYRFIFDVRREPCDKKARKRSKTGNKADTGALSFCGLSVFPDCDRRERERERTGKERTARTSLHSRCQQPWSLHRDVLYCVLVVGPSFSRFQ